MKQTAPDWPRVDAWELDDFFRDLRGAVLELESAFRDGQLGSRIDDSDILERVGPDVVASYRMLRASDVERRALRYDTVHSLLDQARAEIFDIQAWCDAQVIESLPPREEPPPAEEARGDGEEDGDSCRIRLIGARFGKGPEEYLRLDQVLAARFWGIGFNFEDPDITNQVARRVAERTASRLARDLRHLQKVLLRFRPQGEPGPLRLVPKPTERAFEQLMLDILNEEHRCARAAPLSEDFLEKTDLRVRYPGLERRRGARVQVTQITDADFHREKLAKIRRLEQFVILSPLALAEFIDRQVHAKEEERVIQHFDLESLWRALPSQPADIEALAFTLKRLLLEPLLTPRASPRGPLVKVPWALRHVIRLYVQGDAFRATRALREHERSRPPRS